MGSWGVCSAGRRCWEEGVGRVDRWFGLELLRLDCYMCDLYFLTGTGASRRMASVEVVVP